MRYSFNDFSARVYRADSALDAVNFLVFYKNEGRIIRRPKVGGNITWFVLL